MRFTGGYTYRFFKSNGASADYMFAGDDELDTRWRGEDNSLLAGRDVFTNVVGVEEICRPDRASNEV